LSKNEIDVRHLARPDVWADDLKLRVDGRPFTLMGGEYVSQVMRDTSQKIVVKKAAQTRFTISFLITAFHRITIRRWNQLYLLPLKQGAIPFVQKRVDPIINSNPNVASAVRRSRQSTSQADPR
jgi:phage terminase large subunit GpA-like protein